MVKTKIKFDRPSDLPRFFGDEGIFITRLLFDEFLSDEVLFVDAYKEFRGLLDVEERKCIGGTGALWNQVAAELGYAVREKVDPVFEEVLKLIAEYLEDCSLYTLDKHGEPYLTPDATDDDMRALAADIIKAIT